MNKVKKIKNSLEGMLKDKKLWIFFGIILIFFGSMFKPEYASDSYLFFQEGWKKPFLHFMKLGRFLSAFFWLAICKTNFVFGYRLSYILAIIIGTLSIYKLNELFERDIKNKFITGLLSVLIVINAFSLELMLFYEKAILMLSVLLNILAIKKLDDWFTNKRIKDFVICFIYMLLAFFAYQGTVAIFLSLGVVYILKHSKNIKDFIIKTAQTGVLYLIPALINYGVIKIIFKTERVESTLTLVEKLQAIWSGIKYCFVNTSGVYPKYLFLAVLGVVTIVLLITILKLNTNKKQKAVYIFGWFYIVLATIISTAAPQFFQDSVSMVPRNTVAIGALFGILLFYLFSNFKICDIITNVFIVISIILLGIQLIKFDNILIEHYQTNYLDNQIAEQIKDKVQEYETETGNYIQYMVLYADANRSIVYEGVGYYGDINTKAFGNSWGARGILDLKLERELIDKTSDEEKYNEYSEYFENQNWDYFNVEEQLILEEDTLYLCVY